MKTERQLTDMLEKSVDSMMELNGAIKSDKPTPDQEHGILFLLGAIVSLGTALDCEDEIKGMLTKMKLTAMADKFSNTKMKAQKA